MSGTVIRTSHGLSHLSLMRTLEIRLRIIPIIQMRKLRFRELTWWVSYKVRFWTELHDSGCQLTWLPQSVYWELSLGFSGPAPLCQPLLSGQELQGAVLLQEASWPLLLGKLGVGHRKAELWPASQTPVLIDRQLLQPCYQGGVDGTAEQWWALPHIPQSMRTSVGCCSGPALHQSQRLCLGCRPLREASADENCHLHPQKSTAFRYEAGCVNSVYVCGKVCPCGEHPSSLFSGGHTTLFLW